jgi:uncharacterized protein
MSGRESVEAVSTEAPPLSGRVMLNQDWRDLTFVHWAVDPRHLERFMPPGVHPDAHDGRSYVGLVPFRMVGSGVGRGRGVPWVGSFLETNVRLYSVDATGRRGIVFLSLDADRSLVVAGARVAFGLPYRWARMRHRRSATGDRHEYESRLRRPGPRVTSHVVAHVGPPRTATPLDEFLTARWGLHVRWWGRTLYVPNAHPPWTLHEAELVELDDGVLHSVGLSRLAGRPPDHVAFSPGVHTEFGFPGSAGRPRR